MDNKKQNNKMKNDNKVKNATGDSQTKSLKSATLIQNPFKNEE